MTSVTINSKEVDLANIRMLKLLDTTKFKTQIKEYEQLETFVEYFSPEAGYEVNVRITKDKAKELLGFGFSLRLPDGKMMKKGG